MVLYRKKKKKSKIKRKMKLVRINDKLEIEVDINIPDEVAKENYLKKLADSQPLRQKGFNRSLGKI